MLSLVSVCREDGEMVKVVDGKKTFNVLVANGSDAERVKHIIHNGGLLNIASDTVLVWPNRTLQSRGPTDTAWWPTLFIESLSYPNKKLRRNRTYGRAS